MLAFGELVEIVTLGVAHEVSDGVCVFAYDDERRVRGESIAQARQTARHCGAQQQRRRIHRARAQHYYLGADLVIARLPRRRFALGARGLGGDPHGKRLLADGEHLAARDYFHAILFGARQLHAVCALLGLIGTTQIAEARPAAAFDIHRELLHIVVQPTATCDE